MGFNKEQIKEIRLTIKEYNYQEPFTDEQIEEYIGKLNDISQIQWRPFDHFYWHMVEHLEGLHYETFKQWIDKVHEKLKEQVETDSENNIYSDSE